MKFMLLVCSDGQTAPKDIEVLQSQTPGWVDEMDSRGIRLLGGPLQDPNAAVTVRVRDGETLITDGPFVETKEWVAGFDLLECADIDQAVEVAAKHPLSWFHSIEVRPLHGDRLGAMPLIEDQRQMKFMFMVIGNDQPYSEAELAVFEAGLPPLIAEHKRRNSWLIGHSLQGPETAKMVRVRDSETLVSDGPFAETKEFIAGFDVLSCETREAAIEIAAIHPVAALRMIEIRPFWEM
jgi:hypothetical protein